jgi:hypothetical protein
MEPDTKTLAFLLCMHRSGSSLTASIFQQLGMSLGPFPLVGVHSSNIHGHFESLPLQLLNRKVQEIALGFPDDFPESEEVLTRFLDWKGIWPEGVKIPDELFDEGRRLVAGLIGSGGISGFKDPRTVLTWPFWRQVLQVFPSLRVVVVPLLRSPHEIATSLCTRSNGVSGYWTSLDLVAIHFGRMKAILESMNQATRAIGFGSESFLEDLAEAARFCGLTWNKEDALRVFDQTCVHQDPATVVHEAQMLYEELGGQRPAHCQAERNGWLLARDARKCEALTLHLVSQTIESHRRSEAQQVSQAQELSEAQQQLSQAQQQRSETQRQLSQAQQQRSEAQRQCSEAQRQCSEAQQQLSQSQQELSQVQQQLSQLQQQLSQTQAELGQAEVALSDSRDQLATACGEMSRAQDSERRMREECQRLREQRDRFESHLVLGQVLRARRRLKGLLAWLAVGSGAE